MVAIKVAQNLIETGITTFNEDLSVKKTRKSRRMEMIELYVERLLKLEFLKTTEGEYDNFSVEQKVLYAFYDVQRILYISFYFYLAPFIPLIASISSVIFYENEL